MEKFEPIRIEDILARIEEKSYNENVFAKNLNVSHQDDEDQTAKRTAEILKRRITDITSGDPVGEIRIYQPIGTALQDGISGAFIASEIERLAAQHRTIRIRVNSYGGSVLDGLSIGAAMTAARLQYGTVFVAHIDGIAASIAFVLCLFANRIVGVDYGLVMTHKTRYMNGEGEQKTLDRFNDSLAEVFRRRLNISNVDQFFGENDKWLSMSDAKAAGLVDEIQVTEAKGLIEHARKTVTTGAVTANSFHKVILNSAILPGFAPLQIRNMMTEIDTRTRNRIGY